MSDSKTEAADQARDSDVDKRASTAQPSNKAAQTDSSKEPADADSQESPTVPPQPSGQAPLETQASRPSAPAAERRSPQQRLDAPPRPQTTSPVIKKLKELNSQTDSDCFVQLVGKDRLLTKQGKPYYKLTFRDKTHSAQALIWNDGAFFETCETAWSPGDFFKIRATLHPSKYGPKLEIRKARPTIPGDKEDGFEPDACRPTSSDSAENIMSEIVSIANKYIGKGPLLQTVLKILKNNRVRLIELGASRAHHRSYAGGLLEHTLSVVKLSIMIAEHFKASLPLARDSLSMPLIVAGAVLHDIGQIGELEPFGGGFRKTMRGKLVGHCVIGAEILRSYASAAKLDPQITVRLEHLILTHSRFADWGSPTPPSTLEAMVLHYADYADSTFASALNIVAEDRDFDEFTQRKGPFDATILKPPKPQTNN